MAAFWTLARAPSVASPRWGRELPRFASARYDPLGNIRGVPFGWRGRFFCFDALYFRSRLQWCTLSREELMFNPKTRLASQWQCSVLMLQQRGLCASCTQPLQDKFEAHHRQHYSEGGATSLRNLELLCPACHRAKHSKR